MLVFCFFFLNYRFVATTEWIFLKMGLINAWVWNCKLCWVPLDPWSRRMRFANKLFDLFGSIITQNRIHEFYSYLPACLTRAAFSPKVEFIFGTQFRSWEASKLILKIHTFIGSRINFSIHPWEENGKKQSLVPRRLFSSAFPSYYDQMLLQVEVGVE